MTAAIVWAILILVGSGLYLAGDVNGRRAAWNRERRRHRRIAEDAYEAVSMLDAFEHELAGNDRSSVKAPTLRSVS